MRSLACVLMVLVLVGCVTGPVKEGPVTTRNLQDLSTDEGAKLVGIAVRATMKAYDGDMALVWNEWKRGEGEIKAKKPSGDLTPDQARIWAATTADGLVELAAIRDNKLVTLDRKRVTELSNIRQLHANQVAVLDGIVAAWKAQGEVSTAQYMAWLSAAGAVYGAYHEQHIKHLREEAKKAAEEQAHATVEE